MAYNRRVLLVDNQLEALVSKFKIENIIGDMREEHDFMPEYRYVDNDSNSFINNYMILGWDSIVRLRRELKEGVLVYRPDRLYIVGENKRIDNSNADNSEFIENRGDEGSKYSVIKIKNSYPKFIFTRSVQSCMAGIIFSNKPGVVTK